MFTLTEKLDASCHAQPRLSALLSCRENFMPLSWHMPVSKSPFRYAIAMRDENQTHKLLQDNQEFAINFLDYSFIEAMNISGSMHGGDKFRATGLNSKKANTIQSTLIEEAYMIYECKVVDVLNFGDHDIFIADVVCIHNKIVDTPEPTLFLGRGVYDTTTQNPKQVHRVT